MIETMGGQSADEPAEGAADAPPGGSDSPAESSAPPPQNPLEQAQADAADERRDNEGYQ